MTETAEQNVRRYEEEREAVASIRDMLSGWVWKDLARKSIRKRMRVLELALAGSRDRDLEEIRFIQGQHAAWRELLAGTALDACGAPAGGGERTARPATSTRF